MYFTSRSRVGMLGVGGAGMRGLAFLLRAGGSDVWGTDIRLPEIQNEADLQGVKLMQENEALEVLPTTDVLIYSDAVLPTNPVRQAAAAQGILELAYHQALGKFSEQYHTVAVAGTHGKSSTTAMLAHILLEAGLDPTVLVGAHVPILNNRNAKLGRGKLFIVEADEYREHFLTLFPFLAVVVSIDFDHPDYYQSLAETQRAYETFLSHLQPEGTVISSDVAYSALPKGNWPKNRVIVSADEWQSLSLLVPGEHMKQNAALAVAAAVQLGVSSENAKRYIASFSGIGRRFESLGKVDQAEVISDYGHHPREIKVTLQAAQDRRSEKGLAVLVEIHMLERLVAFQSDYVDALQDCEEIIFVPVFTPTGREKGAPQAQALLQEVANQLREDGHQVVLLDDYSDLESHVVRLSRKYGTVLAFSAGILDSKLRAVVSRRVKDA